MRYLLSALVLAITAASAAAAPIVSYTAFAQPGTIHENDAVLVSLTVTVDPLSPEAFDFANGPYFGYLSGLPADFLGNYGTIGGNEPLEFVQSHGITVAPGDSYTLKMTGYVPTDGTAAPGVYALDFWVTTFDAGATINTLVPLSWTVTAGLSDPPFTKQQLRAALSVPEPASLSLLALGTFGLWRRQRARA